MSCTTELFESHEKLYFLNNKYGCSKGFFDKDRSYFEIKLSKKFRLRFSHSNESPLFDPYLNDKYICQLFFNGNEKHNYFIRGESLRDIYKKILKYLSDRVEFEEYKEFLKLVLTLPVPPEK